MRSMIALMLVVAILCCPLESRAQPPAAIHKSAIQGSKIPALPPIIATYDVYVGGLHFLQADILFREQKQRYHIRVHAHTYGYLYKLLKWDGLISAQGRIKGERFVPAVYSNIDTWRDKPKTTWLRFDTKGNVTPQFDPPNTDQNRESVNAGERRGALDPESALLQMLANVAVNDSCAGTVPVFDGKRRFDLIGEDRGGETINEGSYGIFKGDARLCDVSFNMIAGEWKDEREKHRFWDRPDGQSAREAFHIWLGRVANDVPELPVRLESGSVWGLVVVHLTKWHYATPDELKS